MGREIRRVEPNWEHPRYTAENSRRSGDLGQLIPCFDETIESVATEWMEDLRKWEAGEDPDRNEDGCRYFWEWDMPPDPISYRPAFTSEPTWFQLYETVSEGTPVTPPFATEAELIDYLCTQGDFWSQKRQVRDPGSDPIPTREQATALVKGGWAPSMLIIGGETLNPAEAALHAVSQEK